MAICNWCKQEMLTADDCTANRTVKYPDGVELPSIPYENEYVTGERRAEHRCHDCGVKLGNYHHVGCDMERCRRCGGQLISCGCLDDEDIS